MIKQIIGKIILLVTNWKAITINPDKVRGTVLIAAPHTSNWDLFYGCAAFWKYNGDIKFLIKEDFIKNFWYGWFFRWLGGVGVNRSQKKDLINYCSKILNDNPRITLVITPEGTRLQVENWKLGFYYIALNANVPISLAFVDYEKKIAAILKQVYPNEKNLDEILKEIEDYYKDVVAKYPENYNPKII